MNIVYWLLIFVYVAGFFLECISFVSIDDNFKSYPRDPSRVEILKALIWPIRLVLFEIHGLVILFLELIRLLVILVFGYDIKKTRLYRTISDLY